MRIALGLSALALLAACGGTKANNGGTANAATNTAANNSANTAAPANAAASNAASANAAAPASAGARPVRVGINSEHGMDACHTQGRLKGQGEIAIRAAPDASARQTDSGENGLIVDICEEASGWVGIVWLGEGDPEHDCGTGTNLPAPKNYDGPCRSGWVPQASVEVTAG